MSEVKTLMIEKKQYMKIREQLPLGWSISEARKYFHYTLRTSDLEVFENTIMDISDQVQYLNNPQILKKIIMESNERVLEVFCVHQKVQDQITMKYFNIALIRKQYGITKYIMKILIDSYIKDGAENMKIQQLKTIHSDIMNISEHDNLADLYDSFWDFTKNNMILFRSINFSYEEWLSYSIKNNNYRIFERYVNLLASSEIKSIHYVYRISHKPEYRTIEVRPYIIQAILSDKLEFADLLLKKFNCTKFGRYDYNSEEQKERILLNALSYCKNQKQMSIYSMNYFHDLYIEDQLIYIEKTMPILIRFASDYEWKALFVFLINVFPHYAVTMIGQVIKEYKPYIQEIISAQKLIEIDLI